ncbi:TPM domain-containing protein [Lactococcus cremoris]|uniref:TPM domain-containing protein n=1 Tax=Lactococcus lactis subsp. cremoris TaxID=1359 RepID=UPI001E3D8FAD|nr:TPM domain-containing protein [Lactococcus cremoris]MCD6632314.1 TPM domain-containing protein [Lactococcus cremoris]
MKRKLLFFVTIVCVLICTSMIKVSADSQNFVDDQANILSIETKDKINSSLNEFTNATINGEMANPQYAVLTIDSLEGESIEKFSKNYFNSKGIGDKKNNLGILLVFAVNDHKYRTQLGKGWNGNSFLNEGTIKEQVYRSDITDDFRAFDYDEAVSSIVNRTLDLAKNTLSWNRNEELLGNSKENYSNDYNYSSSENSGGVFLIFSITILVISGFVYLSIAIYQKNSAFKPRYTVVEIMDFISKNEKSLPLLKKIEEKVSRLEIVWAYRYDEQATLDLDYMIPYFTRISINLNCLEGVRNTVLENNSMELITQYLLKLQNNNHRIYSGSSYLIRDLTMFVSQSSAQILAPVNVGYFYSNDFSGTQKYSGDSHHAYTNSSGSSSGGGFSGGGGSSDGGGASGGW